MIIITWYGLQERREPEGDQHQVMKLSTRLFVHSMCYICRYRNFVALLFGRACPAVHGSHSMRDLLQAGLQLSTEHFGAILDSTR